MSAKTKFAFVAAAAFAGCLVRGAEERKNALPDARTIVEESGVSGGLVVLLGCGDGKLACGFGRLPRFLVHVLEQDSETVARVRGEVKAEELYGKVSVEKVAGKKLPYADGIINLLVARFRDSTGRKRPDRSELDRVLAPGGVAYFPYAQDRRIVRKAFSSGMDDWSHALHGPDNNAVSKDVLVGPPRRLRWTAGPRWGRSHDHLASVSVVVAAGGRVFSIVDEGPIAFVSLPSKWRLVARDAFSGVLLWKREISPWEGHLRGFRSGPPQISRRLVATRDSVYVTLGYDKPVSALSAATGELIRSYEETKGAEEILYDRGTLFVVAGDRAKEEKAREAWRRGVTPPVHRKRIFALKAQSGKLLWRKADSDTEEVMPTTLAVAGGRVFFQNPDYVICLDASTGREIWRSERPIDKVRFGWSTPTLVVYGNVVLSADRLPRRRPEENKATNKEATGGKATDGKVEWIPSSRGGQSPPGELIAFSARTGERLWSCPCREGYNSPVDVLVADGLVWTGNLVRANDPGITEGRDPATGEVKRRRPPDPTGSRPTRTSDFGARRAFTLTELLVVTGGAPTYLTRFLLVLYLLNLILGFFNLIPVPPLDGAGMVRGFLPRSAPAGPARNSSA